MLEERIIHWKNLGRKKCWKKYWKKCWKINVGRKNNSLEESWEKKCWRRKFCNFGSEIRIVWKNLGR